MDDPNEKKWSDQVDRTLEAGCSITSSAIEFDRVAEHVFTLLSDAVVLFDAGSFARCLFLSVTSMEECAKLSVGMFRRGAVELSRHKDVLYSHKCKHILAAAPTVGMGTRLVGAIGADRIQQIVNLAQSGGLVELRERALYATKAADGVRVPSDDIDRRMARDLLLYAIETFDDSLGGLTNMASSMCGRAAEMFERIARE